MAKLGPEYRNQSLSCGTMLQDDIFNAVKRYLPQNLIDEYQREKDPHVQNEILNGTIWDYMDSIAPEGCNFGSHPGEGADFGFWESEMD